MILKKKSDIVAVKVGQSSDYVTDNSSYETISTVERPP